MWGLRRHRQKGPDRGALWKGGPTKGARTRDQTGWGAGCSKVTSEVTMGALPRDGETKELEGPQKISERVKASENYGWVGARMRKEKRPA